MGEIFDYSKRNKTVYCKICDQTLLNRAGIPPHVRSKKHIKNLEEKYEQNRRELIGE